MAHPSLSQFNALFYPATVVVVGSVKEGKIGNQIITHLLHKEFTGTIYAVNPKARQPAGYTQIAAFSSVEELDTTPDLAIICAPAPQVATVLEECGRKGIPVAVLFTAGFSEAGNREAEENLKQIAGRYGIRLIGPNCAGIMNTAANLCASIELCALPGNVAFITQSGAVGGAVLAMAEERGIGFSKFVSCGNRADIGENELLEYLEEDQETEAIALYVESMQDGREFLRLASRITARKPIIIIKAGRSSSGLRATSSHTGSMAGSDQVFEAMVKQSGCIRVDGIEEMLDLCQGFSGLPPVKGEKVAVVTNSGGPSILTADKAEEVGLTIAEPADGVKSQLYEFLPSHCSVSNPIDLTVEASEENYLRTIDVLLEQEYDSVIAINVATPFLDSYGLARGISEAAHRHEKPVAAVFMAGRIVESGIEKLREEGIPPFPTGERAAVVLRNMLEFSNRAAREVEGGPSRAAGQAGGEATRAARETGAGPGNTRPKAPLRLCDPVLEPEAVDFLENSGFSFPGHQFVSYDKANMEAALAKLSFPVVMKVVSPKIIHKSDSGGVMLGLETAEQVHEAFDTMSTTFSGQEFRGVMLYEQVPEALEIIVGLSRDADFGPVIAVGAGGIYTELMRDVSLRIAPFSREEARHMVEELAVYKLLEGFRGKPGLDIEAVVDCVMRLSEVALNYPQIRELDLNPVFVRENGALVGDVRILTR